MIAFEKNRLECEIVVGEKIQHRLRGRPAIDIVAKENDYRLRNRVECDIYLDLGKHRSQKIGAAVNISNGIDAHALGNARGATVIPRK